MDREYKKKNGIFYTPDYICKYMCVNALLSYLNEFSTPHITLYNKEMIEKTIEEVVSDNINAIDSLKGKLHNVKILDPACGEGIFLIETMKILYMLREYIESRENNAESKYNLLKDIISNNLFGVDKSASAIKKTKENLTHAVRGLCDSKLSKTSLNFFGIKQGDALFSDQFNWRKEFQSIYSSGEKKGFDIVIGNPPYVDIKTLDERYVSRLFEKFKTTHNRINLYSVFIERSLNQLIKENGILSFIIPNSLLYKSSYENIRKKMLHESFIREIIRLPNNIFQNVSVETIIITLQTIFKQRKQANNLSNLVKFHVFAADENLLELDFSKSIDSGDVRQEKWIQNHKYMFSLYDEEIWRLLEKIESNSQLLGDKRDPICEFSLGITPYDKYKGHTPDQIESKVFHSDRKIDFKYKPLLKGKDIRRYRCHWNENTYIKYGEWLGAPRSKKFFTEPRILVRQIVSGQSQRILAAYVDEEYYNTQIAFNLLLINEKEFNIKYILALLNSELMSFYHLYKFLDPTKKVFQKVLIQNARRFPIIRIDMDKQEEIAEIVDKLIKIIELRKKDPELRTLRTLNKKIDDSIYDIYNISDKEKKIIKSRLNSHLTS
ncbi:MAG: N-6 DNA methylase [Candidatus Lokiarchaeota archaeon]|nr:N-6 DNA methylase [Candidatus Lokiarchaeota archaeon]